MSSRRNPNPMMTPPKKKSMPRKINNPPPKFSHKRETPSPKYPQLAISSTGAIDSAHLFSYQLYPKSFLPKHAIFLLIYWKSISIPIFFTLSHFLSFSFLDSTNFNSDDIILWLL